MRLRSGQITVFLSIIFLAIVLLAGVLVDASRISAGEAVVKKAVNSAARSVLAKYGSKLKDNYGIFALPAKQEDILNNEVMNYIAGNLSMQTSGYRNKGLDLYGFRIEEINVTPVFNLSENKVFRQQVLEYMKYRAPKEIVEGFLDRLAVVKEMGKISGAYRKKVEIDSIIGKMDKVQQRLKKDIDGSGAAKEKFINGFNLNSIWNETVSRFEGLAGNLYSSRSRLEEIDGLISRLKAEKKSSGGGNNDGTDVKAENEGSDMEKQLKMLEKERDTITGGIGNVKSELEDTWMELRYSLTGDYIKANEDAAADINSIIETGKNAEASIRELETFLDTNFKMEGTQVVDFITTLREDVNKIKGLILSGQKASSMLECFTGNTVLLKDITTKLDTLHNEIERMETGNSEVDSLIVQITGMAGKYADTVNYLYEKPEKGNKKDDPRTGKAEAAKEALLENLSDDRDYTEAGVTAEDLPSYTKVVSKSFNSEDAPYIERDTGANPNDTTSGGEARYESDLGNVGNDIDLYNEDGKFQENALGYLDSIGKMLAGDLTKLRDNIYINEYVMGTFKCSVPALKPDDGVKPDTDLSGREKSGRDTFFNGEVEYILHGNASEKTNEIMTKAQILLVRFGLNTLHVYTDSKKKELAAGIAAAVAGWWTGGAGIPVLSNLIMCGWGMGEAVIDVKDLMDGKSVPIFKLKGDWKLETGSEKSSGPKTDQRLSFSYYDYMRLFLLAMDENKKLGRMEDLIQLNMKRSNDGFKMSGCNTYIRVEAVVSMKYLFITQPFVPKGMKTNDGRYKFKALVYEGY